MNAPTKTEDAFHQLIHRNHMWGLWEIASQMTPQPRPQAVPYQWKWSLLEEVVKQSATAVPVGDERRAMQLFNPGLNGQWATTNTLIAAVQVLLPGEVARAHRHSPAAIRFIMSGNGAYTAVESSRRAGSGMTTATRPARPWCGWTASMCRSPRRSTAFSSRCIRT
jgi:gentisate 1,2-dioxygenase